LNQPNIERTTIDDDFCFGGVFYFATLDVCLRHMNMKAGEDVCKIA